jgi:hypothetical protein
MSGQDLLTRLKAAEDVCVLFGWTGVADSERGKATTQLWQRWVAIVGSDYTQRKAHPDLNDERITELAHERDEIRQRTLARILETGS